MIIVRVELWPGGAGPPQELARLQIINDGSGDEHTGNYDVATLRGRTSAALDRRVAQRSGRVEGYPRLSLHVWSLVARALNRLGYDRGTK